MNRIGLFLLLSMISLSCQSEYARQNPFTYHAKPMAFYSQFVNKMSAPKEAVSLAQVMSLKNDGFPMQLALFEDHKFYYLMETLGDGFGEWEFDEDKLHLYAERSLFVMHMNVRSIDEHDNSIAVDFVDRFGNQYLQLDVVKP